MKVRPHRSGRRTTTRASLAATLAVAALVCSAQGCAGTHNDGVGDRGDAAHPDSQTLTALPLVEVPAARAGHQLAVVLSGDGNWAAIDRQVAMTLADSGVAVVGLRSRSYLSGHRRTPEELAADVTLILRHYMPEWGRDSVMLVGYSRGADFVPFVANRLPPELRGRLSLLAMLALAPEANFEFHWLDLVRNTSRPSDIPTWPEVERLRGLPMLCVYGREEVESACHNADSTLVTSIERDGGHHFDGNYTALGDLIVHALHER